MVLFILDAVPDDKIDSEMKMLGIKIKKLEKEEKEKSNENEKEEEEKINQLAKKMAIHYI